VPEKFRNAQRTAAASTKRPKPSFIGVRVFVTILSLIMLAIVAIIFTPAILRSFQKAQKSNPIPDNERLSAAIPEKSIAVLPFENLSDDKANTYFADGIQEEILTRLSKVADLKVISRTSTQRFKSAPENLSQIAKQLGVANILEGSVQKSNDQVRVNVQLINAGTDTHIWADVYDRKLTDIFSVESDIAKTIVGTLKAKLTGSEKTSLAKNPTANTEAYQLYLKGRFFWNKRTAADLRKSIEYFNQAIQIDPGYGLAYAAIAQAWVLLPAYGGGTPKDCFPPAEAAAKKALELDDSSSEAYAALGSVRWLYEFNLAGAIENYERAIQLNPNDATAHHWLGTHPLTASGQHERAISEIKRALELDPLSLIANTVLGFAYIYEGRVDEAIPQLRKVVEMDRSFYFARYLLGIALEQKGMMSEAISEYEKAIAVGGDPFPLALLGQVYGKLGRKNEALQILARLRQSKKQGWVPAYGLSLLYLGLGDRDEALNSLEESYQERDGYNIELIRVDPFLNALHGDVRFETLAEKIVPARQFGSATAVK
jgi:TolB-like protein/Flp pilus assembly protein TadD